MTELEKRLLKVLVQMTSQYMETGNGELDHEWMHAGENAVEILSELGLVSDEGRQSRWTEAGHEFLKQAWSI